MNNDKAVIKFNEDKPYTVVDKGNREVKYAEKSEITDGIVQKYHPEWLIEGAANSEGTGGEISAVSQSHEPQRTPPKKPAGKKNVGNGMKPVPPNRRQSSPGRLKPEVKSNGQT